MMMQSCVAFLWLSIADLGKQEKNDLSNIMI